mgnify:CR=1 FL=1
MPIWPMPKEYTRGETTLPVDVYNFHFVPNVEHPDILRAIDRYTKLIFGDNQAAIVPSAALREVQIDVKDYDVVLNVSVRSLCEVVWCR